jgi:hypothetical protein
MESDRNEMLFKQREKRISDTIALRVPDRVPITCSFYFFPARYYGCSAKEMMYDPDKIWDLHLRAILEFQPDLAQNPFAQTFIGPILDALDYKQMKWPGAQLDQDVPYQFVEGEYMKAEEYDHFFSDSMDFIVRKYWPRISGKLKALERLPSLGNFSNYMSYRSLGAFSSPEMLSVLETLLEAGQAQARMLDYTVRFNQKLSQEGFPSQGGGAALSPYDLIGDLLRGTKGLMLDLYRRPETVIKACEKILPLEIERGISSARRTKSKLVFIPLHKGLDGFMSTNQFLKFYWPFLRELIIELINADLTPYVFWEGDCASRLEYIKDIPPGKALYRFESTDMMKAKDQLADRVCIRGNVPISLLNSGDPKDVRAYCKKLIDYAGRDGGLILDSSAHITDAKPENVRAMFESVQEYGVY